MFMHDKMKLTMKYVVAVNKAVQEVSTDADTVRKKEKLEQIINKINEMLDKKDSNINVLAYILHSIPTEQPFSNGNHRTAYYLFYELCYDLREEALAESISLRDEAFIRFLEFLTLSQLERELKRISLQGLK